MIVSIKNIYKIVVIIVFLNYYYDDDFVDTEGFHSVWDSMSFVSWPRCSGADVYRARETFGSSERLYSSCPRARPSALALFTGARPPAILSTSPLLFPPLGCEGWKLEESKQYCVLLAGLLGRGSGCEAGEPEARMRRAATLSPEHISACWSEHDRRVVQMPMPDLAESEQR